MENTGLDDRELVSALADGELRGEAFSRALELLGRSDQAMADWQAYHVAGDVLRCSDMAVSSDARSFAARVRNALDGSDAQAMGSVRQAKLTEQPALQAPANDPTVRWKLVSGVACLVAVASIGWHLRTTDAPSPQVSAAPVAGPFNVPPGAGPAEPVGMVRDARLDELMAAHKQFGGTGALQAPSGFLRNATFESQTRR